MASTSFGIVCFSLVVSIFATVLFESSALSAGSRFARKRGRRNLFLLTSILRGPYSRSRISTRTTYVRDEIHLSRRQFSTSKTLNRISSKNLNQYSSYMRTEQVTIIIKQMIRDVYYFRDHQLIIRWLVHETKMATLVLLVGTSQWKKISYRVTSRGLIGIITRCQREKKQHYKNDKTASSKNLKGLLFAP